MTWTSKVIWSEGLFLRPQHFQQQDRYLSTLVQGRCGHLRPYAWGFSKLVLDEPALQLGKLVIRTATGILPDGTPFNLPDDGDPPPPFVPPAEWRDVRLRLALPLARVGLPEVDRQDAASSARYRVTVAEVRDSLLGGEGSDALVPLELGEPRWRWLADRDPALAAYTSLAVAQLREVRADGSLQLEPAFLPACLDCQAVPPLAGYVREVQGLLHQRGEALAPRVSASGRGAVAEIADFLLLQVVNRYEPLFAHFSQQQDLHPEAFFRTALQLAGELATFVSENKRPPALPVYQHDDLQASFTPLLDTLRQLLSAVTEQNAIALPLHERKFGVRVSPISDRALLTSASFVLAVRAQVPAEQLLSGFPAQIKIGPAERIAQLVNAALPGIALRPLPVAPRQLPYHAGFAYFELDRNSEYWPELATSAAFAFHIGGQFPGLELAFWAIRS